MSEENLTFGKTRVKLIARLMREYAEFCNHNDDIICPATNRTIPPPTSEILRDAAMALEEFAERIVIETPLPPSWFDLTDAERSERLEKWRRHHLDVCHGEGRANAD